jgi:hypothetical protein
MNEHHELALWAASCAERVLALFVAENPGDYRLRRAIEGARQWQRAELGMIDAQKRAFAAHASAPGYAGAKFELGLE